MMKDKLFTSNFCFILAANFLLFFAFYLLLPVLPFYLKEEFMAGGSMIGFILSCYTIACLCIRPFSGYLLDTFSRKPLYLLAYFVFTVVFGGYMLTGMLFVFIVLRIVHGFAFGMVSVAGNTIVIDILPAARRGEGLGYYGLANNVAMSFGPMAGLFMHNVCSYEVIFTCSLLSGCLGVIMAGLVRTSYKVPVKREPLSLDRFLLVKGIPAGFALLLLSIPYGMTTTYVAMYADEIGIRISSGLFFTCMAVGLAVSRIFSGKQVDKGRITWVIQLGMYMAIIGFAFLFVCRYLMDCWPMLTSVFFLIIALLLGVAFGTMFPAFNTLFVNLAPNNQRGTATSTYLTSWDFGIGLGLMLGGVLGQALGSFNYAYLFGAILTVFSAVFFRVKAAPHFDACRLR